MENFTILDFFTDWIHDRDLDFDKTFRNSNAWKLDRYRENRWRIFIFRDRSIESVFDSKSSARDVPSSSNDLHHARIAFQWIIIPAIRHEFIRRDFFNDSSDDLRRRIDSRRDVDGIIARNFIDDFGQLDSTCNFDSRSLEESSMFAREFRNCLKDPRRLIFIFGASIVYLFLFGMLYQPNIVQKIPTVIFDEDQSKLSREIVQNFSDSDTFEIVDYARDESEMLESIQMKRSLAAIHIPKYFARDRSSILYMVNGSNIIVTNVTSSATLEIVESFEEEILNQTELIHLRSRILYNPTQGYMKFFVIGLSLIAFQQGLIFAIGAASFDEGSKIFSNNIFFK